MGIFGIKRIVLQSNHKGTSQNVTLTSAAVRPLIGFGWTAATLASSAPNATFSLTNDAGGQFSIGGNMLRLEKPLGVSGTQYTITVLATATGYATTTVSFVLTLIDNISVGLVERVNALNISKLYQDAAQTNPITASGQPVNSVTGSVAGWQATGTNGPVYTTNVQNGLPGFLFNGTSNYLSFITSAAINFFGPIWTNNPWSIIAIILPTDTSTTRDVLGWGNSTTTNYLIYRQSTTTGVLLGSGGTTTSDGGSATPFTGSNAAITSISSDGALDTLHLMPQTNGIYGYSNSNGNPTFEVSSTYTSGTMTPNNAYIGRRSTTPSFFKGYVLDLLFYNREIGPDEMQYIHSQLATQWGITLSIPTPTYLDTTNFSLWWQDDFDGTGVNWTPTYGTASPPTGWNPGLMTSPNGNNAFGSGGANSSEIEWYIDPRNPAFSAAGVSSSYNVSNSVLNITTQNTPTVLNVNTTFNITATTTGTNLVTTNANFSALGIVVGMSFITGTSGNYGNLAANTLYYIASIPNNGANSTCTLSTTPPYLSTTTVALTSATGTLACTCKPLGGLGVLTGGLNTHQWKNRQFGIIKCRFKMSKTQNGVWPAWWLMSGADWWNAENDIMEFYSDHSLVNMNCTLHCLPYPYATGSSSTANIAQNVNRNRAPFDQDFHEIACKWDETGLSYYVDGISIGTLPPFSGVRKVNITNPGSGLTNGTYTLYSSVGAKLTLTVTSNTVSGYTIVTSGSGLTTQPTWYTNSALTTPLSTTLPGVTLTVDYSGDPAIPMTYYEPAYAILNLALGSAAGTLNTSLAYPSMYVDRVQWYKKVYPVPATMTPGYNSTFDGNVTTALNSIVSYWSGQGVTMSTSDKAALSTFIRTLMSYQLRFDTLFT